MKHFTKQDIQRLEKVKRLNIINSVSGIKPANLIGTGSNNKITNLAIFSSVVHLGSNPSILGFILRPNQEVRRHTYENILETGYYTINHIHESFYKRAHYTSAKFDKSISEFNACGLEEEYLYDFPAPFVKESQLKLGMRHLESVHIKINNTYMVVGEIEHLMLPEKAMSEKGYVNLDYLNDVGIGGLNSYYRLEKIDDLPYARVEELPDFKE